MLVEVAAAVIQRADGAFLLAQRPQGKVYAGYWEFPGGKIEPGEPAPHALARELHEELGLELELAYPWITRVFRYPHAKVRLHFFRVTAWRGDPHPREAQEKIVWQRPDAALAEPMLPANAPVLASLALPVELAITDAATYGVEGMLARLEARLAGGLRFVQLREKAMPRSQRERFARQAIALARRHGARVVINSDLELAREAGADGVHLTATQLNVTQARPSGVLVGASCHDEHELARAMRLEFDYALLGPVKPTRSHPQTPALGWKEFASLARGASIPLYAVGGMRRADLEQAWRASAHGVAMISGSWH